MRCATAASALSDADETAEAGISMLSIMVGEPAKELSSWKAGRVPTRYRLID
jgi:hypothetical protein